jgi:hypothetical protein
VVEPVTVVRNPEYVLVARRWAMARNWYSVGGAQNYRRRSCRRRSLSESAAVSASPRVTKRATPQMSNQASLETTALKDGLDRRVGARVPRTSRVDQKVCANDF